LNNNWSVRLLIQEKAGISIEQFFSDPKLKWTSLDRLVGAFQVFISGIEALKKLHYAGIVHGDIHPGNIVIRNIFEVSEKKILQTKIRLKFHLLILAQEV
jgi:serine/threonine protein kinase